MIKLLSIAVISAVIFGLIKKYAPEYTTLIETGSVIIVLFVAYPYLCDLIDFFRSYGSDSGMNDTYLDVIIKSLGIALVTEFSSDICNDNGESALATKIEFAGKLFMIITALPMIKTILELAVRIIDAK